MGSAEGTTSKTRRPSLLSCLLDLRQLLVQRLPVVENEMGPFQHALALRREPQSAGRARSNGGTPSSCSSCRMRPESVGCVTLQAAAARVKCFSRARAAKD